MSKIYTIFKWFWFVIEIVCGIVAFLLLTKLVEGADSGYFVLMFLIAGLEREKFEFKSNLLEVVIDHVEMREIK